MSKESEVFIETADVISFNAEHRRKLQHNITQYDKKVVEGKLQYKNLDLAKERASALKNKVIENLDKYLIEFEAN